MTSTITAARLHSPEQQLPPTREVPTTLQLVGLFFIITNSHTFKKFKTKALKNPVVKTEYEAFGPEYNLVKTIIKERIKRGWSQTELAEAVGSRQPVISRLERCEGNPSLKTLGKIAKALDLSLKVSMQ